MRTGQHVGLFCVFLSALAGGCSSSADGGDYSGDEENLGEVASSICTAVKVTSDDADYEAVPGQSVTWTGTPTCSGSAQYQFWFRNPQTGVWILARDWSSSSTYVWNTTGLPTGVWNMQLWVRDVPSGTFQANTGRPFTLTTSPACTAVSSSVSPSSGVAGTSVTFTNSASTCPGPEYAIYRLPPGGGAWLLDSPYSTANATYVWNTTGAATGFHQFQIWARQQGSTKAYQVNAVRSFTVLGATPCTSTSLSFSPVSPSPAGTAVTLNAAAGGCGSPTFRYFLKAPAGQWQELQPYTSSATATWNTTLATPGAYNLEVWARNSGSALQYESTVTKAYTLDVSATTGSLSIGGGYAQNCEILSTGKVACWGYNAKGELGNGTTTNSKTPVAVTGLTSGISLGVGYEHGCAVNAGGTVSCWGQNLHGQLGNGGTANSSSPVTVPSLTNARSIAAGNSHTCVALADGAVKCWGYNSQGQLGDGTKVERTLPVSVPGITTAQAVAAGYYHSCALLADGTVRCWGQNTGGALGNGTGVNSVSPVTVAGLSGVTSLNASSGNTCAVKSDGTIWCWGGNSIYGTLGNGSTTAQLSPVQVTGISTATAVAVGPYHACAALQNGTATCWGFNAYGQLGNATKVDSLAPVAVSNLTNVKSVGIAQYSSCAILTDGNAACWGYNSLGSLGNGLTTHSSIPVTVAAVP